MNETIILETDRLILTSWQPGHLDDIFALHADPRVARFYAADGAPWSKDQCRQRLAVWLEEFSTHGLGKQRIVRKSDKAFLGRAGYSLHAPTGEPELGYALFPAFWGHGYATEISIGLRDWFFETRRDDHFIGFAHVDNTASCRVLERIGMIKTHVGPFSDMPHQFYRLDRPAP